MQTIKYTVPAIHCGHCTHTIELELRELDGVRSVKADQVTKSVVVTYDEPANDEKIRALLREIEYPAA
ncbi:MAG TPA: heavy-metal-associated domain-containing protein [Anaerolineales bacterium]|nr:heavy-metal-associated domain-containing protein [Anaerolineales bacterium]